MCDIAWELGMSEREFYERFDIDDRHQILATHQSLMHRALVARKFPVKGKGK